MNRPSRPRRHGLALSAAGIAGLLLAALLLAGSVQSAGQRPRSNDQLDVLGLPKGRTTSDASASVSPFRRRQSVDHPFAASTPAGRPQAQVEAAFRSSPVMFIENVGQFDPSTGSGQAPRARFQVRGGTGTMWLAEDGLWITLLETPPQPSPTSGREPRRLPPVDGGTEGGEPRRGVNLKLGFPGANPHPRIEPFDRLDTVVSYFIGNDPAKWRPDVPVWAGVRYVDLYPGVDLEITSEAGHWTWRLACRANCQFALQDVRLRVEGADALTLESLSAVGGQRSAVVLTTAVGDFTLSLPTTDLALQVEGTTPNGQPITFRLPGVPSHEAADGGQWTADAPAIGRLRSAITQDDPDDLLYSTFLGGSGNDWGSAITVGGADSIYVTGVTLSSDFPITAGAFDSIHNGFRDTFVVKLNAGGTELVYATFLGGGDDDRGRAIAVDGTGNAYVAGGAKSSDFPTTVGAFDTSHNGDWDAFVVKLNAGGTELVYASFLGGRGRDCDLYCAVTVDGAGSAYVAGGTRSSDFPTTAGAFDTTFNGDWDAFVAKLNANGAELVYATFLGGSGSDRGWAIAVDCAGNAYVTAWTRSSDFPTTAGAFDTSHNGGEDAFVVKVNVDGAELVYATFLGGSNDDYGNAIAVDGAGSAYVAGWTKSSNFPTTAGAFDMSFNGGHRDAFVAKLNANGAELAYATFLGGSDWDRGRTITVDGAGSAYVAGWTRSSNFPTTAGAFDMSHNGGVDDAFVVKVNAGGTGLAYATFLGGRGEDIGIATAVDGLGNAFVAGWTWSSDFPTTAGAFDMSYNGGNDAFVAKLAVGSAVGSTYCISGRVTDDAGSPVFSATVSATGPTTASTTTDSDGRYTLPNLPAGTYSVSASKAGYVSPPARGVTVPPDANNVDFVLQRETYSISGRVANANNIPISGVAVSDDVGRSATTDVDGNYTLSGLLAGAYTLTPDKSGYAFSPVSRTVSVPPDATAQDFTGTLTQGLPTVQRVQPCFTGAYWPAGAYINNRFTAHVDWQGTTPGRVHFTLNDTTSQEIPSPDIATHTYDMGADLQSRVLGARNLLHVAAYSQSSLPSAPRTQTLIGYGLPLWLPQGTLFQAIFHTDCPESPLRFRSEWRWKLPVDSQVTIPDIPVFGGKSFGLHIPPWRLRTDVSTDGSFRLEGGREEERDGESNKVGITVAGHTVFGRLTVGGEGRVSEAQGLQITAADFKGEVGARVKVTWPVVDMICKAFTGGTCLLREAESLPLIGRLVRWFNERAQAEVNIEPAGRLETRWHTTSDDGWVWDWLDGGGRTKTTIGLSAKVVRGLAASVYGGGEPNFSLKLLPDPGLDRMIVRLFAGLKLRAFRWESTYEAGYEWHYPEIQLLAKGQSVQRWARTTPWQPVPRNYAEDPSFYAVFRADRPQRRSQGVGDQATEQTLIASNIYPYADPALAVSGAQALLVWTHDDISKPLTQGEEVRYTFHNGSAWSSPVNITDDHLEDFAPQVTFDGFGHAVAVWERMRAVKDVSATLDITYTRDLEIAYAVWDEAIWTAPVMLTDNTVFDHAPVLSRGRNGKLMLLWRQNAGGELIGHAVAPDALYTTVWDGSTWSTPVTLNITDSLRVGLAYYDDTHATLVYARDTDGDLSTSSDQELYAATWNGAAWGSPTRLTNDSQPDNSPVVLYDAAGAVRLLWLKGETLHYLSGTLSGAGQPVTVEGSAAMLDYRAALDPSGNLVVVWQGLSAHGADAYYAVYDSAADTFGLRAQLTDDRPLEKMMSPTFADTGQLWLAFAKDQLITTTVTISPTLVISNVTTFGQSDLYVLTHSLGRDLAVSPADIALSPANPAAGSTATISATVRNLGDLAVAGAQVAFYQEDPAAGGTQIGPIQVVPSTLAGGMSGAVSVQWNVPLTTTPQRIYVVADPSGAVDEWDEENNKAFITTLVPDLVVTDVRAGYGPGQAITLTATISNAGMVTAQGAVIAFRLDALDGPTVAEAPLGDLASGAQVETRAVWDAAAATTSWHTLYAVADALGAVVEANEDNNSGWVSVGLLPDLVLRPADVSATLEGDSLVVTVTVHNEGARDASGATLGLYGDWPQLGDAPSVQRQINVPAGGSTTTALAWPGAWWPGLYVGVNADGTLPERDLGNNIALFGQTPWRLHLPLVVRNH